MYCSEGGVVRGGCGGSEGGVVRGGCGDRGWCSEEWLWR